MYSYRYPDQVMGVVQKDICISISQRIVKRSEAKKSLFTNYSYSLVLLNRLSLLECGEVAVPEHPTS